MRPARLPVSALIVLVVMLVAPGKPLKTPARRTTLPRLTRALACCRAVGVPVIYTTHVQRPGGCDLGHFADNPDQTTPTIGGARRWWMARPGSRSTRRSHPRDGELVIRKHRYSAVYGTDLEIVLRGLGVTTVVITWVTTENCCHATARDALFRDFRVVHLADATATFDYLDLGYGSMTAEEVHRDTLVILTASTAEVIPNEAFVTRVGAR